MKASSSKGEGELRGCGVLCFISLPPSIFIGGSHGQGRSHLQLIFGKPTYSSNKLHPRVQFKSVGPMGRSAGPPVGPATFPFGPWVPCWAHLSLARILAFIMSVSCSGGPSTPYSDTCRVLIRWNVVSWIKPHHCTAKSARNHLHTF